MEQKTLAVGLLFNETELTEIRHRVYTSRYAQVLTQVRATADRVADSKSLLFEGDTFTEWYYVRNRLIDLAAMVLLEEREQHISALNEVLADLASREVDFWQGPRYPNRPRTIMHRGKEVLAGELETAQLAMGISIAYDWGYRHLSSEVRAAVEKALKNVARPLLRNSVEFQSEKWVMNHLCVISVGLILSTLVSLEKDSMVDHDVEIARNGLNLWIGKIDRDGSYGESVHYWAYPTNCLFFGVQALHTVLGHQLEHLHRMQPSFEWALCNHVGKYEIEGYDKPVTVMVNQYDSPFLFQLESPEILLYTRFFKNPVAQWYSDNFLLTDPPRPDSLHHVWHRSDGLLLMLDDAEGESVTPEEYLLPHHTYYADTGFVYLRDGWKSSDESGGDIVFALQSGGGGRSRSHEHYDKNSISLFAHGEYLIVDPGHSCYRGASHIEWDTRTIAHNTLTIDSKDQHLTFLERGMLHDEAQEYISYDNQAHIVGRNFQEDVAFIASEARFCYEPRINQFTRRVWYLRPDCFLIWDRVDTTNVEGQPHLGFNINNYDGKTSFEEIEGGTLVSRPKANLQMSVMIPDNTSFAQSPSKLHMAYHIFEGTDVEGKEGSAIRLTADLSTKKAFDFIMLVKPLAKDGAMAKASVESLTYDQAGLIAKASLLINDAGREYRFTLDGERVTLTGPDGMLYRY